MKKKIWIVLLFILMVFINVYAYEKGDVDGNGSVASNDYVLIRKHILKQLTLTGDKLKRANVDGDKDGKVNSQDYVALRKIIINKNSGTTTPTTAPTTAPTPTAVPTAAPTATPVPVSKLHFINVESGDATLIESNGKYGLIDAANPSNTGDDGFDTPDGSGTVVLNYLKKIGVTHLEFIIASHSHSDHIGGIPELVKNSSLVDNKTTFIYKDTEVDQSKYGEIILGHSSNFTNIGSDWKSKTFLANAMNAITKKKGVLLETSGHSSASMKTLNAKFVKNSSDKWMDYITFTMGDLNFKIYNLYEFNQKSGGKRYIDLNSNSLVVYITAGNGKKAWLSGDLNTRANYEEYYAKKLGRVDVFKANHHGHTWSNSFALISRIKPSVMVIPSSGGVAQAARAYIDEYGGKSYFSGFKGTGATVVSLGSQIEVSGNYKTKKITKNTWYSWNYADETVYYVYIGENGKLAKNEWVKSSGKWYYLDKDGFMVTKKWVTYKGKSYYLDETGACTKGC